MHPYIRQITLFTFLTLLPAITTSQNITPSTPSLDQYDLTAVSCSSQGTSAYCIAGGACCADNTCCGVGLQCVSDSSTGGYGCEASKPSSSNGSNDGCVISSISCSNYKDEEWTCKFGQTCGTVQFFCVGQGIDCLGGSGSGSAAASSTAAPVGASPTAESSAATTTPDNASSSSAPSPTPASGSSSNSDSGSGSGSGSSSSSPGSAAPKLSVDGRITRMLIAMTGVIMLFGAVIF